MRAKVRPLTRTVDSILAACTLLCIRDVIDADETWQDNLEFALHMISKRGGPLAMLKASDTSFTRRYLLENLAVHDVFGASLCRLVRSASTYCRWRGCS